MYIPGDQATKKDNTTKVDDLFTHFLEIKIYTPFIDDILELVNASFKNEKYPLIEPFSEHPDSMKKAQEVFDSIRSGLFNDVKRSAAKLKKNY